MGDRERARDKVNGVLTHCGGKKIGRDPPGFWESVTENLPTSEVNHKVGFAYGEGKSPAKEKKRGGRQEKRRLPGWGTSSREEKSILGKGNWGPKAYTDTPKNADPTTVGCKKGGWK